MASTDVRPDRLTVAKLLARELVTDLAGHRLGLVHVEGEGEVLAPLTLDRSVVDLFLDSLAPASLPTPGSRLSHGLGRALLLFPPERGGQRVVVLLSDGEDHGEDWDGAVKLIRESGVIVHTVGVGTGQGALLPVPGGSPAGGGAGYKLDEGGRPVLSKLQPAVLQRVARETGGVYVEADSAATAVTPIVAAVSRLATRSLGTETVRQQQERFQWFVGAAVAALAIALATSPFRREEAAA
jgi:Ca-activated chloride channel family protein